MKDRIKAIRLAGDDGNKLTLAAFGSRIGISAPSVAKLESGQNAPSEQTIRAICNEFGVRRQWLETGEEPMYVADDPNSAETLVPDLVDVLNGYPDILALMRRAAAVMTADDWEHFNDFLRRLGDSYRDGS